jgi:Lon protease-like protein
MLPSRIPIFPLPNVVLFPDVTLPLHIFEPRYRQMVQDVAAEDGIIGMMLLRAGGEGSDGGPPGIWRVGCAGKIIRKTELSDGRFNILLQGMREFVCSERFDDLPYATADVEWRQKSESPGLEPEIRGRLVEQIRVFVGPQWETELQFLGNPSLPEQLLVNLLGFALKIPPEDKQCLLEEATLEHRASRLLEILEFHLALRRAAPGGGTDSFQ